MGIGDFLDGVGDVIGKLNKWTSLAPSGMEQKPLFEISGDGLKANLKPGETHEVGIEAKAEGFNAGLETTMSGMRWLYSNGISQPLATAALVGKQNRGKNDAFGGDYFNASAWSRSWKAANHISPGQALFMNPEEAERAISSPLLYYKPSDAYLPPGFESLPEGRQQQILKEAGMPAIGNAYIEKKRGYSGWFKYGTGALDFASVTFLDPTYLAAKTGVGVYKANVTMKAPKGGWSTAEIDQMMGKTQMTRLMEGIWANRDNPQLLNNTAMAQHSGMGPRFGAVVSKLADEEELSLFVRTGMGDIRALEELRLRNTAAASRMDSDLTRLGGLDLMRSRYANSPQMQGLIDAEMTRLNAKVNADTVMVQRYDEILKQENLLDQLHVSRWSLQRAADKTAAQNEYLAGAAKRADRPVTFEPTPPIVRTATARGPIDTGYTKSVLWGAGDYFSGPVNLVRSLKNAHPNGYMRVDTLDKDSIAELRGHLARIPGIKESTRANILNSYLKTTTEAERLGVLEDVGRIGAAKVAERYGVDAELAQELYRRHTKLRQGEIDNMKRYSAGMRTPEEIAAGQSMHIDEFTDAGGKVTLSPFTVTRLVNGHTFQDLDQLAKVLKRHGSKLQTLRRATGSTRDAVEAFADYSTYLWKFTTLFRLGYIPRVLGDDLAGQWVRAGTAAMALRTTRGVHNAFTNVARFTMRPALQAREQNALNGASYAAEEMALLQPGIRKIEGRIQAETQMRARDVTLSQQRLARAEARLQTLPDTATPAQRGALEQFVQGKRNEVTRANERASTPVWPGKQQQLTDMKNQHDFLARYHDLTSRAAEDFANQQRKVTQGSEAVTIDGHTFPAAFGGKMGDYYRALTSADESVGNIFNTNKQIMQGNLERSFDHGGKPISPAQDPAEHLKAWTHAINNQIMQDPLERMIVMGKIATPEDAVAWMTKTPAGKSYRARLPKMLDTEDIARSQFHEVDQYLHTPEIRMKAMEPDGVNEVWLDKAVPQLFDRPDVHVGQVGQAQLRHANALDRVIQGWFKIAATMPANRMSRHPLFNSFYEGHLKRITGQYKKQGRPNLTVGEIDQITDSARQLALRDTRDLVFDIAHRSDAAAATRFLSPFFAATSESFQRWGRIIADKPQVAGFAANWYNSPAYTGRMQDLDGNPITDDGHTYVPVYPLKEDGTPDYSKKPQLVKRQVPKGERYIVTRVPKWFANSPLGAAFNVTEADGKLMLSQNSINLVTQGDPWFNPGVGPIVQIPVNEFVKDKPRAAEVARELGILPFGPSTGNVQQRLTTAVAPKTIRDFMTAFDTGDQRYQQIKMQIMQREIYEFSERTGRAPTQSEIGGMSKAIADKTKKYWLFSASSAFLQPFATQRKDPYQFYRDQYNALRRQNPLTADDEFLGRYGESYFVFAQEITKSQGVPPTIAAVDLTKKYGKLIAANPELAALIIGPDGQGPFSREAYAYQLNNPLVPGASEMTRGKMSADEAMKENQKRLGWAKFTARMNQLTSELHKAGFQSFADEGAEDLADQKSAWTKLYSEPLYPDGSVNPYYNEEWSKDFLTFDARKYDRLIPSLTELARSELAQEPRRTDLRTLQVYLGGRQALMQELDALKQAGEPHTLTAEANQELRFQWVTFVSGLVEKDTRFGDLHHRYLSRDMGVDAEEGTEE